MKSREAQLIQAVNQEFLDKITKILGENWTIKSEVDDLHMSLPGRTTLDGGTVFANTLSFRVESVNSKGMKTGQGFSDNWHGSGTLNEAFFDKFLDSMKSQKRIPDDHYITLKGRKNIELANELFTSLTQKNEVKPAKKLKL